MKKFFQNRGLFCVVLVALLGVMPMFADPVLPYSGSIADKLSNDIAALELIPDRTADENKQLKTDISALNAYHKVSTTWSKDISILKSLHQLLAKSSGYPVLIDQAAQNYLTDFETREADLRRTTEMSPRSSARVSAFRQLNAVSNILVKAEAAKTTRTLITQLSSAARKIVSASNATAHAAAAKVKLSSAVARIGKIDFNATPGQASGMNTNGILDFLATDNGFIRREIEIHLEGVTSETPATYELGVGANTATYTAVDPQRKSHGTNFTIHFHAIPGAETNRSVLIIDAITTNYLIGRFKFTGFSTNELNTADTNRVTTITNGEFQLTF